MSIFQANLFSSHQIDGHACQERIQRSQSTIEFIAINQSYHSKDNYDSLVIYTPPA